MKGLAFMQRKWIESAYGNFEQRNFMASKPRRMPSAILVSEVSVRCLVEIFLVVVMSYLNEATSREAMFRFLTQRGSFLIALYDYPQF